MKFKVLLTLVLKLMVNLQVLLGSPLTFLLYPLAFSELVQLLPLISL